MTTETTRRGLLKAAPVVVIAAAIPATPIAAADRSSDMNMMTQIRTTGSSAADAASWERVKAAYQAALAAREALLDPHTEAERKFRDFIIAAPEAAITYQVEGFTTANGLVSMKAYSDTIALDRNNWRSRYLAPELKAHPDYIAFCERMEAWENQTAKVEAERRFKRLDDQFVEACEVVDLAWDAIAKFPVDTAPRALEKIQLLLPEADGCPEWHSELLMEVRSDLERIAARA